MTTLPNPPEPRLTRSANAQLSAILVENAEADGREQRKNSRLQGKLDRKALKRQADNQDRGRKRTARDQRARRLREITKRRRALVITILAFVVSVGASMPLQVDYFSGLHAAGKSETLGMIGASLALVVETAAWVFVVHGLDAAERGAPVGRYRVGAVLLAGVAAGINYLHGGELFGNVAGAALALAAMLSVVSVESYVSLQRETIGRAKRKSLEERRADWAFRVAHPIVAAKVWRFRALSGTDMTSREAREAWWELRHQAGLGLRKKAIERAAEKRGEVAQAMNKLAAAPYQDAADAADGDEDGPVLIIPGVTGHPGTVTLVDVLGRPIRGAKTVLPTGKQGNREIARQGAAQSRSEDQWEQTLPIAIDALDRLEKQAESDRRLVGPTGTVSPKRLAQAVGIRAVDVDELIDRMGQKYGRSLRQFHRVNGHDFGEPKRLENATT